MIRQKMNSEAGMAMIISLAIILISSLLASSYMTIVIGEAKNAAWQKNRAQALFIAEAGIQKCLYYLNNTDSLPPEWIGENGNLLSTPLQVTEELDDIGEYTISLHSPNEAGYEYLPSGTYLVDSAAVIERTGRDVERNVACIAASSTGGGPEAAIIIGGDLMISGNPSINGSFGSVHANGDLDISGNPTIAYNATASDTYSSSGSPEIGGTAGGGFPLINIPEINPEDYEDLADYLLKRNGRVYEGDGTYRGRPEEFRGWKWGGDKWDFSGNTRYDGIYYIEGDAIVSGNPGESGPRWNVSIFAEGSIEISGNPRMQGILSDILFVAGGDLKINGNPDQAYEGYMLAHEQLMLSGNPILNGAIIAEDAVDNSGFVSENLLNGDSDTTYNGDLASLGGETETSIVCWYEVRAADEEPSI